MNTKPNLSANQRFDLEDARAISLYAEIALARAYRVVAEKAHDMAGDDRSRPGCLYRADSDAITVDGADVIVKAGTRLLFGAAPDDESDPTKAALSGGVVGLADNVTVTGGAPTAQVPSKILFARSPEEAADPTSSANRVFWDSNLQQEVIQVTETLIHHLLTALDFQAIDATDDAAIEALENPVDGRPWERVAVLNHPFVLFLGQWAFPCFAFGLSPILSIAHLTHMFAQQLARLRNRLNHDTATHPTGLNWFGDVDMDLDLARVKSSGALCALGGKQEANSQTHVGNFGCVLRAGSPAFMEESGGSAVLKQGAVLMLGSMLGAGASNPWTWGRMIDVGSDIEIAGVLPTQQVPTKILWVKGTGDDEYAYSSVTGPKCGEGNNDGLQWSTSVPGDDLAALANAGWSAVATMVYVAGQYLFTSVDLIPPISTARMSSVAAYLWEVNRQINALKGTSYIDEAASTIPSIDAAIAGLVSRMEDAEGEILYLTSLERCIAERDDEDPQQIPSDEWTNVVWNAEDVYDYGDLHDPSGDHPDRVYAKTGGMYAFSTSIMFYVASLDPDQVGWVDVEVLAGGSFVAGQTIYIDSVHDYYVSVAGHQYFDDGLQYFTVRVKHNLVVQRAIFSRFSAVRES